MNDSEPLPHVFNSKGYFPTLREIPRFISRGAPHLKPPYGWMIVPGKRDRLERNDPQIRDLLPMVRAFLLSGDKDKLSADIRLLIEKIGVNYERFIRSGVNILIRLIDGRLNILELQAQNQKKINRANRLVVEAAALALSCREIEQRITANARGLEFDVYTGKRRRGRPRKARPELQAG